jgi:AcrR family transcriptional regulator
MSPRSRSPQATDDLRAAMIDHARTIVAREGPNGLTMRALAAEAGCAVGLPYKVFEDRRALVVALVTADFHHLVAGFALMRHRAGQETVAENLHRFADLILEVPSVALVHELMADHALVDEVVEHTAHQGIDPSVFEEHIAAYLEAEQSLGRIGHHVETRAIAELLFGALHNLLLSPVHDGPRQRFGAALDGLARTLAPIPHQEDER